MFARLFVCARARRLAIFHRARSVCAPVDVGGLRDLSCVPLAPEFFQQPMLGVVPMFWEQLDDAVRALSASFGAVDTFARIHKLVLCAQALSCDIHETCLAASDEDARL